MMSRCASTAWKSTRLARYWTYRGDEGPSSFGEDGIEPLGLASGSSASFSL